MSRYFLRSTLRHIAAITALALAAGSAFAQPSAPGTFAVQLRVATGKAGKGFSRVFADIRSVCGNAVPMVEVETEGGLQNLTALAANKADLGFVQVDTFLSMRESDPNLSALQVLMPMNTNLLHVIARSEGFEPKASGMIDKVVAFAVNKTVTVRSMADLKGQPVAVVGSARALGREVDRQHKLGIEFVDVATDEEGLAKVKRGQVAALFSTSGWPSGPVQALKRSDGLHLVRYEFKEDGLYQVVVRSYENVDAFKHPFLAVPNVLMTRSFSTGGAYGKAVGALRDCVQRNIVALREGPYEPMWQEVRVDGSTHSINTFGVPGR